MTDTTTCTCPWCAGPMSAITNRGGKKQRFCSAGCRTAYHSATRKYGEAMVESGLLPASHLRSWYEGQKASAATCTDAEAAE